MKDTTTYELVLVIRVDDLEDLPGMISEARKRVRKITEDDLDGVGGEESGAETFCAGWFDFNLRDRTVITDPPEPTKMPFRMSTGGDNSAP